MIGDLLQRGTWRFPEIRSVVRSTGNAVDLFRTRRLQVLTAGALAIAVGAVGFAAVGYVRHNSRLADAQLAASRVESANIDLQDELARLRDKMAANSRDLAAAQGRVAALVEEARARPQPAPVAEPLVPAKSDKPAQLATQLHAAEAQRATLAARLSKAEADLAEQQAKQAELANLLDQWQKSFQQLTADRDRLKARVGELEKQSALHQQAQQQTAAARLPPAGTVALAAPARAPAPAPGPEAQRIAGVLNAPTPAATPVPAAAPLPAAVAAAVPAQAVAPAPAAPQGPAVANSAVDHFARVLASAGVDVRHLFAEFGVNKGEGGPFIPVANGQPAEHALSPEKLAALRAMVKVLPVAAPLERYDVSSPFGVRGDPENGHAGFHTGIDLTAPYDSPVYATAPGVVTYAGYRDDYGKIVEIDHGNGIATRYAHLHAFTVSVGQRIAAHTQVGYLGSTGRATGPHVHYEVVVNGEPQDPQKFFGLARYVTPMTVPVAARN
jgi:murein DD-endopeptidase MepM/ murein hydrolase activator NlpD